MNRWFERKLTTEMIVRMFADALFVNVALAIALAGSFLSRVLQDDSVLGPELLVKYFQAYRSGYWQLTVVSLIVFYGRGLYTRVRMYRMRYKLQIIVQAVSLSYVVFGFLAFMFPETIRIPRTILFWAWGLTIVFLITARAWVMAWRDSFQQEIKKTTPPADQKCEFSLKSGISQRYNEPINVALNILMTVNRGQLVSGYGVPRSAQIIYEKFFADPIGEVRRRQNGRPHAAVIAALPVIDIYSN